MKVFTGMVLFVGLMAVYSTVAANGSVENLMEQANTLYKNNHYEEAIKTYEQILEQGYESEAVYYNLGNSFYRIDKIGYAILNYEKGLRLAPDDEDISYNLAIANAHTVDKIKELPKLFFIEWWDVLVTSFSANNWLMFVLVFYYLLLLTIGGYFLIRRFKLQRYLAYWGVVNLGVLVFLSVLLFSRINKETSTDFGILLESAITAKQSPNEKSNDVFVIHEGIKFEIEDKLDNWAKIKLADGKIGWLPEDSFGKI